MYVICMYNKGAIYNLATLCLQCVDFMDVTMEDAPHIVERTCKLCRPTL